MTIESDILFLFQAIVSIIISYGLGLILIQQLMKRKKFDGNMKTAFIVNGTYILFGVLMGFFYSSFIISLIIYLPWDIFNAVNIFWFSLRALINIFMIMILVRLFYRDTYKHGLFVGVVTRSITTFASLILFHLISLLYSIVTGGVMSFLLI